MSRRASSLNVIDSGLSREIGSHFDDVKKVADNLEAILKVGESELVTLSKNQLEVLAALTGVDVVVGIADSVEIVAGSDLVTLTAAQWLDILDVAAAAKLIKNLQVTATQLESNQPPSATLNNGILDLGIPKAVDGANGTVGLTPIITLSVDGDMNLVYDIEYVESLVATVKEW